MVIARLESPLFIALRTFVVWMYTYAMYRAAAITIAKITIMIAEEIGMSPRLFRKVFVISSIPPIPPRRRTRG